MLRIPTNAVEARNIYQELFHMKHGKVFEWLEDQVKIMDFENRMELDERVLRMRQGAAQAISQIIEHINNSKDEIVRLEGSIKSQGGTKR